MSRAGEFWTCIRCGGNECKPARRRVFCASLADVFDNEVPSDWRVDLFRLILATPNLDWLLLTKRIGKAHRMIDDAIGALEREREAGGAAPRIFKPWPIENVWLGATVVNQEEADRDVPKLLAAPARVRFLSIEPMLGSVDLSRHLFFQSAARPADAPRPSAIDWVIVGGESGPHARPMHPDWPRSLRDQCSAAGVPFHFKQHGEWAAGSGDFGAGRFRTGAVARDGRAVEGGRTRSDFPPCADSSDGWAMVHWAGKKSAGRQLDGRTWDQFP